MGIVKSVVSDVLDTIEDLFAAIIGVILIVFMVGAWYGITFSSSAELYYPFYLFVALLVYKLAKDIVTRTKVKKK